MPPRPLINIEIQKYYQNEPKWVLIQDIIYLNKRDGAKVINPDEYKSIGTHWVVLYVNGDDMTYFDSFGIENNPEKK